MFDKKKEETAAPEPSDLAAGIPSVAGKRSTGSKQSAFLLFAACVVVGFIGIAAWQFKGTLLGSDEAEVVPENDLNVYTSSKSLTVPPVPPKRAERNRSPSRIRSSKKNRRKSRRCLPPRRRCRCNLLPWHSRCNRKSRNQHSKSVDSPPHL